MIVYSGKDGLKANYTPLNTTRLKRKRSLGKKIIKVFLLIITAAISVLVINKTIIKNIPNAQAFASPIAASLMNDFLHMTARVDPKKNEELKNIVLKSLEGSKGTYGIAIKNIKTGQSFNFNADTSFQTASLYKLWIMAMAYTQMYEHTISGDDELSDSVQDLNAHYNISSDEAELTEGEFTFTVNEALEKMITISHNYAALLLSDKVKIANVKNFLSANGFDDSSIGSPPKTTAADMEMFFEKIYRGELINQEYSQKMVDLLKRQELNNKLPKSLPQNVVMAHKTGELEDVTHDAGIVYSDKGDYIIVIMSQSDNPAQAEERIAGISKSVYDYFQSE